MAKQAGDDLFPDGNERSKNKCEAANTIFLLYEDYVNVVSVSCETVFSTSTTIP